jgi:hypothetical protein
MPEFTKAHRKTLRELAAQVYEADARIVLGELEGEFLRWRANEMESSELLAAIHEFQQVQSRELWSRYHSLKDPEIVARGIAFGLLSPQKLPETLATELAPLIGLFMRHKEQ